jgi:hypothetical protein
VRIRRLASLLSAGALAVGLIIGTGGAAQATTPPSGGDWAELYLPFLPLINNSYRVCFDVPGGSTSTGTSLQMFHCHGYASNGAPQRWQFVHLSDDSYWIYNQSNLLCVTAFGPLSSAHTARIKQAPCGSFDGQAWYFIDFQPDASFQLLNSSPTFANMCLAANANANNSAVLAKPCNLDAFQIWALG